MCVRREDWEKLGGFCEDYQNSAEDTDFCFRVMTQLNKKIAYNPNIELYHYEGKTLGLVKPFDQQNIDLLLKRWPQFVEDDWSEYQKVDDCIGRKEVDNPRWIAELPQHLKVQRRQNMPPVGVPYRIEIGSGMHPQEGYIHIDIMGHAPHIDIVHDINDPLPIGDNICAEILGNHVVEHFSWRKIPFILQDWCRVLKKGGKLILRTPNLEFIMSMYKSKMTTPEAKQDEDHIKKYFGGKVTPSMYANLKLFSGQDYPSNFHFACYDYQTLTEMLIRAGFSNVAPLKLPCEFSPGEIQIMGIK
jgi:predicted SAM-dependent methyltransferase